MGNSLATLQLVFRSLLSTEPWLHDPFTLPIPWREEKVYSPAKEPGYTPEFGFMENDRVVAPHPPVKRALEIVRKALEESGHRVSDRMKLTLKLAISNVSFSSRSSTTGLRLQTTSRPRFT